MVTKIPRNPTTLVDDEGEMVPFGKLGDAKATDPDAESATIAALLRGILAEMQAQTALLTTIAANTTPAE